ncbi:DUF6705 family protein [Chryseobacterium sp. MFBS3-17]|uniref:DUF6705 family protein n=1 Tax=Chryseobacterium sp. MFBS3-17 TaxID=2886689 RepID=UPI001D0F2A5A|nr:DUF6705 family protein [Chryseobacterium sp. MFBS3-17]MCC2590570.1 hypothetical protein [Chryseobacterium sp. MFBS3-17]
MMKKIICILAVVFGSMLYSQKGTLVDLCPQKTIVPLRAALLEIPEDQCYYMKDTLNELPDYEGTWTGTWNGKIIYITFKKMSEKYSWIHKRYNDFLIAKFKTVDANGNILFDNTQVSDENVKIKGLSFRKIDGKYSFIYIDPELCYLSGSIRINFTDATKTQMEWSYGQDREWVPTDCYFYHYPASQHPEPLPQNVILTKQ